MPTEQGSIVLGAAHDIAPTMPPFSEEILPLERSVTIRELTPEDADLITAAFDILDHPANDIHMVDVTESESDIVERINTPGTYVFVGVNETGEVIGTAMATDSKKRVRRKRTTDIIVTSVELFATKTSVQSQRSRSAGDEPGYGTHMYQALEKYLFEDNGITSDGLQREMITIRIKRGVPGWERMLKIALNHGYVDEKQYAHLSPQELTTEDLKGVCQSLSLVYRRRGWFKNFLVNSNGGTFPMLVCSLS